MKLSSSPADIKTTMEPHSAGSDRYSISWYYWDPFHWLHWMQNCQKNNRFLWLFLHFNKLDLNSLTFQMRSIMNSSVIITRTLQKTLYIRFAMGLGPAWCNAPGAHGHRIWLLCVAKDWQRLCWTNQLVCITCSAELRAVCVPPGWLYECTLVCFKPRVLPFS